MLPLSCVEAYLHNSRENGERDVCYFKEVGFDEYVGHIAADIQIIDKENLSYVLDDGVACLRQYDSFQVAESCIIARRTLIWNFLEVAPLRLCKMLWCWGGQLAA